jgi:hypothetical protein
MTNYKKFAITFFVSVGFYIPKGAIHKKIQQDAKIYQTFIIPYLCEAQYVSGDTSPIIRSLKLYW